MLGTVNPLNPVKFRFRTKTEKAMLTVMSARQTP